jgi:hypothetical protein
LAASYAAVGDFDKAVATERQAIDLLGKNGSAQLRTIFANAMMAYQAKKPPWQSNGANLLGNAESATSPKANPDGATSSRDNVDAGKK